MSMLSPIRIPVRFQSTPPARGATSPSGIAMVEGSFQSTPPREGGDLATVPTQPIAAVFQSTPPARGATLASRLNRSKSRNFNPRPPRGGRQLDPHTA